MKLKIIIPLLGLAMLAAAGSTAQNLTSVAFYNVENMCDTLQSRFYDDTEFTPQGRRGWNTERYLRKIANIARVADEMSADILGLAEVETREVVQDLVNALSTDYNFIHASSSDKRGMDLAMLYKGDKFFPDSARLVNSGSSREFLYVHGRLNGVPVHIVLCHMPSRLNKTSDIEKAFYALHKFLFEIMEDDPNGCLMVLGDFNASPVEKIMRLYMGRSGSADSFMTSVLNDTYRRGQGSYFSDNTWLLFDNIFVNPDFFKNSGFKLAGAGVYSQPYMMRFDSKGKTLVGGGGKNIPLRTFDGNTYTGGFSDHLPVFMVMER